jgi:hypothetical protein
LFLLALKELNYDNKISRLPLIFSSIILPSSGYIGFENGVLISSNQTLDQNQSK